MEGEATLMMSPYHKHAPRRRPQAPVAVFSESVLVAAVSHCDYSGTASAWHQP